MRKMVDIALSQEERDKSAGYSMIGMPGDDDGGPKYPAGCCLYLDDATIKKLDLDDEGVERGDTLHAFILGRVERVSDGPEGKCVHLQITSIGLEDENSEAEPQESAGGKSKKRYGADEEESD